MVGEVGTGKTTLLKTLHERLDENTKVANIFNTGVTFKQILNMALVDLRLVGPEETLPKLEAIHRLNDFAIEQLFRGANVALVVDEAQNLDRQSMENLRLLSNLETRKRKLIQIVLSGQPELDDKLNQRELRQLAQRISLKRYLTPLSEKETTEYIQHRLAIADSRDRHLFTLRAHQLIWEYSGGVPRKINILCDNALLIGYGVKEKRIKAHIVREAIKDLRWSPFSGTVASQPEIPVQEEVREKASLLKAITSHAWFPSVTTHGIIAGLMFIVGIILGNSWLNFHEGETLIVYKTVENMIASEGTVTSSMSDSDKFLTSALPSAFAQEDLILELAFANVQEDRVETETGSVSKGTDQRPDSFREGDSPEAGILSGVALAYVREENAESIEWVGNEDKDSWKTLIVRSGDSFSKLVARIYGRATLENLKLVRQNNTHIRDTNSIEVGQKIFFPPPYSTEE
jgi:general secretion pathway protein A